MYGPVQCFFTGHARPTGPRHARPEDRLLCRVSTGPREAFDTAWMAGSSPAMTEINQMFESDCYYMNDGRPPTR